MTTQPFLGVVQFPHPGGEHRVGADGWTPWNTGPHLRKFMQLEGIYRDENDVDHSGSLTAWGEWEGPSKLITKLSDGARGSTMRSKGDPRSLVVPVFPGHTLPISGLQNTDPYIFGERFLYSVCKQKTVKRLTRMKPGSLLLFGSQVEGMFVLDTAFVLATGPIRHARHTWADELHGDVSDVYQAATLEPMYADVKTRDEDQFSLYAGATADQPVFGMYSFFPCRPADDAQQQGFQRPAIVLDGMVNAASRQSPKTTTADLDTITAVWRSVVSQVRDAGLCLGIHAVEPQRQDVPPGVWPGPVNASRKKKPGC